MIFYKKTLCFTAKYNLMMMTTSHTSGVFQDYGQMVIHSPLLAHPLSPPQNFTNANASDSCTEAVQGVSLFDVASLPLLFSPDKNSPMILALHQTSIMTGSFQMSSQATMLHQQLFLRHQRRTAVLVWIQNTRTNLKPVLSTLHPCPQNSTTKTSNND